LVRNNKVIENQTTQISSLKYKVVEKQIEVGENAFGMKLARSKLRGIRRG
jgi:hypothetical protein